VWRRHTSSSAGSSTAQHLSLIGGLSNGARGGQDRPPALAETDAGKTLLFAESPQNDFVAVFEERACLFAGETKRRCASSRDFQQAALRTLMRPGDSSAGNQVSFHQIAAVAGVVREHLSERPIEIAKVAGAETNRSKRRFSHGG
jgi:hypothetical protein